MIYTLRLVCGCMSKQVNDRPLENTRGCSKSIIYLSINHLPFIINLKKIMPHKQILEKLQYWKNVD